MSRRMVFAWLAVLLGVGVVQPADSSATDAGAQDPLPAVYPVPQSVQRHGERVVLAPSVGVVTGPHSDGDAVRVVLDTLRTAGVRRVDQVSDAGRLSPGEPVVDVGGPAENPASASALAGLGVPDAAGLPAQGYVLGDGRVDGRPVVVLAGHDGTGTFYAAQTLRQLVIRTGPAAEVPGVEIRDRPAYPVRGVVEGFYGTPWSDDARASQFDFEGRHKLNIYVYSPKNDPYLRVQWRDPYPTAQLAQLTALVDRADANHVDFT